MTAGATPSRFVISPEELRRIQQVDRLAAGADAGVEPLLDMLDDPSWTVRRAVIAALAASGTRGVAPLCRTLRTRRDNETRIAAAVDALSAMTGDVERSMLELASDANAAVVADVAQVLGRRRARDAVPTLVALTRHQDDNVAVAAIEALGRIGGRAAVDSLVESVQSGSFFRTFPAIDVLGRSGDPRAITPLTALLDQPQLVTEAARALGRSGDLAAVVPLTHLLASAASATVRVAALALGDLVARYAERFGNADAVEDAIARAGDSPAVVRRLSRALTGGDPQEQAAICFLMGAVRDPSAAVALTGLLDAPAPAAQAASDALRRLGPRAESQVLLGLRDGDSARRRALLPLVTRAVGAPEIIRCLVDADADVRALACEALGRVAAVSAVSALFPLLADINPMVSFAAMAAIQSLGGHEAEALALAGASNADARVRRSSMRILAYFGFPAAIDVLLGALTDGDERVRDSAIQGLPFIEDPRALEALLAAAKDPSPRTRAAAVRALAQCGDDLRVTSYLLKGLGDPDAWVRYYACQALGKLAFEPAAEAITRLLADPAGQVRVAAIEALSCLKNPLALAALKAAVADSEADIRRAAIVGLGVARQAEALPAMLAAATSGDPATRLVALSAIAAFESPEVLQVLRGAAVDPEESVRTAAIGFLSAMPGIAATEALAGLLGTATAIEPIVMALSVKTQGRIEGLMAALQTADDETASALVSALTRLRRPEALIASMELSNTSARKAAASALATLGDPEALAALKTATANDNDPEVRQICAVLLAR